jgi:hypothetical protein
MSEVQPVEVKKRNPLITLVLLACGVIGIVAGIAQMRGGLRDIFGSGLNPEAEKLITDSDAALAHANEHITAVGTAFQALLNDVDALGLEAFRRDKTAEAERIKSNFVEAADLLREAKTKLDEASGHEIDEKLKSFVAAKAKSYGLLADVCDQNTKIVDLVLDKSIATSEELVPKVLELAAKRDESQKAADAATAEADAIVKKNS